MRFIATSTTLLKALTKCAGVIGSNSVLSVLEDFLFELSGNTLTISATDLETRISVKLEIGEAQDDGAICIPAKKLQKYLKTLSEQPITFEVDVNDLSLVLSTHMGKSRIGCEKADDFPKALEPVDATTFTMPSIALLDGIAQTLFAASSDTLPPAMTGVLFDLSPQKVTLVTTDAHRLVQLDLTDVSAPATDAFVVPKKSLQQLKSLLPTDDSPVEISYTAAHLFIETGYVSISCRLIDAKFPDYKAVIPRDNPYRLTMNRADLVAALNRTQIFANNTTHQVLLTMRGNSVQLHASDIHFNYETTETLPSNWSGPDLKIAFNGKLLAEMVTNLDGAEVQMLLSTPTRTGLLGPAEPEEGRTVLMLCMPLMVGV